MNLTIKKGEFVTVIGDVGSGKSSFLSALIGDMLSMDKQFYQDLKNNNCDENLLEQVKGHSNSQSDETHIMINGSMCYT